MENLVLGYTKTIAGTFQVISNNASGIIEGKIQEAVLFLATNGIKSANEAGKESSKNCDYSYNGHNLLHKKRNMNAVIYFCGVKNFHEKIEVVFHKNGKMSFLKY